MPEEAGSGAAGSVVGYTFINTVKGVDESGTCYPSKGILPGMHPYR